MNNREPFRPQSYRKPTVRVVADETSPGRKGRNPDVKPHEIINRYIRRAVVVIVIMLAVVYGSIKALHVHWRRVDARLQSTSRPAAPPPATLPERSATPLPLPDEDQPQDHSPLADLTADPIEKALFLSRRALALEEEGLIEDAILRYEDALALNPQLRIVHGQLGRLYLQTGRLPEAITSLTLALDTQPDSPDLLDHLGFAYLQSGQPELALQAFQAVLLLEPDHDPSLFHAALAAIELRDLEHARDFLARHRELHPEDPRAPREEARISTLEGDPLTALHHLDEAIRLGPQWPAPSLDAARILAALDRPDEAIAHLSRVLDITDPITVFHIYQHPAFRDARLTEAGRELERRIARAARELYLTDETSP
ncbi:MAG TPA: tetratricopeptide repeat protein [Kiritimatiellia bacterium]|nr:tetratricopeptide repeat protein [Kiritimatiellia bacterium]